MRQSDPDKCEGSTTSATLVAAMIFHPGVGSKTARCSSLERFACSGSIVALLIPRKTSIQVRMSCTPGKKIRIPLGFSADVTIWFTTAAMSYTLVSMMMNKIQEQLTSKSILSDVITVCSAEVVFSSRLSAESSSSSFRRSWDKIFLVLLPLEGWYETRGSTSSRYL